MLRQAKNIRMPFFPIPPPYRLIFEEDHDIIKKNI